MRKVIIIDHEPLSIRRRQIFYIDQLIEKGLEIEFWDCSSMFHPGMTIIDTIDDASYKVKIDSMSRLEAYLSKTDIASTVFIVETFDNWNNRAFFKLLSDKQCYTIRLEMFSNSVLPDISIFKKLRESSLSKVGNAIKNKIDTACLGVYKKIYRIKGYDIFISSGNNPNINIHVNHPDWELFREANTYQYANPYAVFLDEYFPLHPDMDFFVKDFKADADKYQQAMSEFLGSYKNLTNQDVIIAAHPKSEYDGAEFGDCQCIKYATASLVKGCQATFMHTTSSLGFAIMADKPVALLSTNDYERTFALITHLERISRVIGAPIYNIEKTSASEIIPQRIDKAIRDNYIYTYLTSIETQDRSNVDILYGFFSGLS